MDDAPGEGPKTGRLDVSRMLTEAMERAGVHPAYIHAVRVCGFVYTEENATTFTAEQVARWDAAVDAWFDEHEAPDTSDGRHT